MPSRDSSVTSVFLKPSGDGLLADEQICCRRPKMSRSRIASSSSLSVISWSISSRSICSARWSLSTPWRLNTRTSTTVPVTPGGRRSDVSRTSEAFSPKMARSSFSSGVIGLSPFGVTLPTRMSPGLHFGADRHDARFVEVAQRFLADVRDVAGDFFRPELGVAGGDLELLDVDRGEHVVADDALGDQDRVLEVVAVPRHERDEHVAAERQFAEVGRRAVGDDVALRDLVADLHDRALGDAGVLVRALELRAGGRYRRPAWWLRALPSRARRYAGVHLLDHAAAAGGDGRAAVARHDLLPCPVPTSGASAWSSGTAWRCMFEPISARLASSFSRNGMSAAATETTCFGETSM